MHVGIQFFELTQASEAPEEWGLLEVQPQDGVAAAECPADDGEGRQGPGGDGAVVEIGDRGAFAV